MLKHIMEIVKGNTEFLIEADQIPRTWRVSLNVWDHFSVHYRLNWVHEDDCTQSALNDHHIKITRYAHRLSQLSLFLN